MKCYDNLKKKLKYEPNINRPNEITRRLDLIDEDVKKIDWVIIRSFDYWL